MRQNVYILEKLGLFLWSDDLNKRKSLATRNLAENGEGNTPDTEMKTGNAEKEASSTTVLRAPNRGIVAQFVPEYLDWLGCLSGYGKPHVHPSRSQLYCL